MYDATIWRPDFLEYELLHTCTSHTWSIWSYLEHLVVPEHLVIQEHLVILEHLAILV